MTLAETNKLHTILAKVETLQNQTADRAAAERLQSAKSELMRPVDRFVTKTEKHERDGACDRCGRVSRLLRFTVFWYCDLCAPGLHRWFR